MRLFLEPQELREGLDRLWKDHRHQRNKRTVLELRMNVTLSWDGEQLILSMPESYDPPPWECEHLLSPPPRTSTRREKEENEVVKNIFRLRLGCLEYV